MGSRSSKQSRHSEHSEHSEHFRHLRHLGHFGHPRHNHPEPAAQPQSSHATVAHQTGPDVIAQDDMPKVIEEYLRIEKAAIARIKHKEPVLKHWPDSAVPQNREIEFHEEVDEILHERSHELRALCAQGICRSPDTLKKAIRDEVDRRYPIPVVEPEVRAATPPAFQGYTYRFYDQNFKGNDALVAFIVDQERQPLRSDYGSKLLHLTVQQMRPERPPSPSSQGLTHEDAAEDIRSKNRRYVKAVLAAYDKAVGDTGFKTDTQLGARADHVTYR